MTKDALFRRSGRHRERRRVGRTLTETPPCKCWKLAATPRPMLLVPHLARRSLSNRPLLSRSRQKPRHGVNFLNFARFWPMTIARLPRIASAAPRRGVDRAAARGAARGVRVGGAIIGRSATRRCASGRPMRCAAPPMFRPPIRPMTCSAMPSWYGNESGSQTANGEHFRPDGITAAHTTLPLPSYVEVTVLDTGQRIIVRVNDRGPFAQGRDPRSAAAGRRSCSASRRAGRGAGARPRGRAVRRRSRRGCATASPRGDCPMCRRRRSPICASSSPSVSPACVTARRRANARR